jgi:hypothetical protein
VGPAAPSRFRLDTFAEVDELADGFRLLATRHSGRCRLRELGRSRAGRPMLLLSIDADPGSAPSADPADVLVVAGAHPNEPVGGLAALRLAELVLEESGERPGPSNTAWHILPCLDPDGASRNAGWLRGPFTLQQYFRHYFRPHSSAQPEWFLDSGFPQIPSARSELLPETRLLVDLIDELRPTLQLSLHGADVGAAYLPVTRPIAGLPETLGRIATGYGIPIAVGAYDAFYWPSPGPGVYLMHGEGIRALPCDARSSTWSYPERYGGTTAVLETPMWAVSELAEPAPHPDAERVLRHAARVLRTGCRTVEEIRASVEHLLPEATRTEHGETMLRSLRETLAVGPRMAEEWGPAPRPAAGPPLPELNRARLAGIGISARRSPLRAAALLHRLLRMLQPDGGQRPTPAADAASARLAGFLAEGCAALEDTFEPRWTPIGRQVDFQAELALATAALHPRRT